MGLQGCSSPSEAARSRGIAPAMTPVRHCSDSAAPNKASLPAGATLLGELEVTFQLREARK